jgi:hypothetical protein
MVPISARFAQAGDEGEFLFLSILIFTLRVMAMLSRSVRASSLVSSGVVRWVHVRQMADLQPIE